MWLITTAVSGSPRRKAINRVVSNNCLLAGPNVGAVFVATQPLPKRVPGVVSNQCGYITAALSTPRTCETIIMAT